MIQTDKERLAVSVAIALLLYAGIFAATGWLNILNPAEPREYFGPLAVEVTLRKTDPQKILPPEVEKPQPEVVPEPVIEPVVEPVFVEPAVPDPVPIEPRVSEPAPDAVPVAVQNPVATPVEPLSVAPFDSSQPGPSSAVSESSAQSEPVVAVAPPKENAASLQAVVVETPVYYGESESVSSPQSETGTEFFESVRRETPTDLRGETKIVYGVETPPETPPADISSSVTDATGPSLADWSLLDTILFSEGNNGLGEGDGNGEGSGTDTGTVEEAGGLIEARNFAELMSQRGVQLRYPPEIRNIGLPGGLRSMKVPVEFTIRRDGTVIAVRVADTGDPNLNAAIATALRKWKFEPIQQDIQQTARLLYVIEAVN